MGDYPIVHAFWDAVEAAHDLVAEVAKEENVWQLEADDLRVLEALKSWGNGY